MNNKKLVFIPKNGCTINNNCIIFPNGTKVMGTEAYVFTSEEFKRFLEDYTNEIITNTKVELAKDWIRKEETINPKQLVSSITIKVNQDSIKDQLTKFLKQLQDE